MKEVKIKMVVDTKSAEKNVKNLEGDVKDVGKAAEKSEGGFKKMSKGIQAVGLAFKAAGIGLIIAVIAGLTEAFSRNKKVMDGIGIVMGTIQEVFSQVANALINTYEAVAKSSENFDALTTVVGDLMTIGLAPLKLAFYNIVLAAEAVKLAYEKMFGDDESIKEAEENLKETGLIIRGIVTDVIDAGVSITKNIAEAIDEVTNIATIASGELSKVSIATANETAKAYQKATQSALLAQAEVGNLIAKYERQSEVQRQLRDDTSKGIDERIEANDKLGDILDKQEKQMLRQADLIIAGANAEVLKNNSIENQAALLAAVGAKEQVISDITGKRSEQLVNEVGLLKEKYGLELAITDGVIERNRKQREFDAEQEVDPLVKLEAQREAFVLERELLYDDLLKKREMYAEDTAERIALEEEYKNKTQDIDNAISQNKIDSVDASIQADKDLVNSGNALFNALSGLAGDNKKMQLALTIAKQTAATADLLIDLGAIKSKATRNLAETTMDGTKAASSTATGFAATLALGMPAAIPGLLAYAASAVGIVAGVSSAVKASKATSAKYGAGGGGSTPAPTPQAVPPSFNLVEGTEGNQIQGSIDNQFDNSPPLKAYVVSGDVTSQQSLDRQIESGSGI